MNRKLKTLGVALVAALALSVVASSAQAAEFHSGALHTILSGSQTGEHEFTTGGGFGTVKCKTAKFAGTTSTTKTTTTEQTITPEYTNCTESIFGRTVDVSMNSCDYLFTTNPSDTNGSVHLNCTTPGDSITLTITSGGSVICTVHIPPQTIGGISYSNGPEGTMNVVANSTGIKSTVTGSFFNCGTTEGEKTGGTYKGNTSMSGKTTAGAGTSISIS